MISAGRCSEPTTLAANRRRGPSANAWPPPAISAIFFRGYCRFALRSSTVMTSNAQCCPYPTTLLASFEPCLPTNSHTASTGPQWAYEIKRDGNRFVCRRETAFGYSPGAATIGLTGCRCGRAQSDPRNHRRELLILIRP